MFFRRHISVMVCSNERSCVSTHALTLRRQFHRRTSKLRSWPPHCQSIEPHQRFLTIRRYLVRSVLRLRAWPLQPALPFATSLAPIRWLNGAQFLLSLRVRATTRLLCAGPGKGVMSTACYSGGWGWKKVFDKDAETHVNGTGVKCGCCTQSDWSKFSCLGPSTTATHCHLSVRSAFEELAELSLMNWLVKFDHAHTISLACWCPTLFQCHVLSTSTIIDSWTIRRSD